MKTAAKNMMTNIRRQPGLSLFVAMVQTLMTKQMKTISLVGQKLNGYQAKPLYANVIPTFALVHERNLQADATSFYGSQPSGWTKHKNIRGGNSLS